MRVLVCGDRHWADRETIRKYLRSYEPGTVVIEGGARGADALAREVAEDYGFAVLEFRAEWEKYGRAAGPIRNERMLVEGAPDVVLAFHNDIHHSRGTRNMVGLSVRYHIPVRLISVTDGVDSARWVWAEPSSTSDALMEGGK